MSQVLILLTIYIHIVWGGFLYFFAVVHLVSFNHKEFLLFSLFACLYVSKIVRWVQHILVKFCK